MRTLRFMCAAALFLWSCSSSAPGTGNATSQTTLVSGEGTTVTWSYPPADDQWSSGLTIGALPSDFEFTFNEGTADSRRSALFHVFDSTSGRGRLEIGRQRFPDEFPLGGNQVSSMDDRIYSLVEETYDKRLYFQLGGVRIEVISGTLDIDEMIAIAQSVSYDPSHDVP